MIDFWSYAIFEKIDNNTSSRIRESHLPGIAHQSEDDFPYLTIRPEAFLLLLVPKYEYARSTTFP
jgi:hypothetical protein